MSSLEELLRGQVLAGESFAVIDPSEGGKALVEVYRLGGRTCAVPSASHELRTTIESNGGGPGIERDSLGSGHGGECSERCAYRAFEAHLLKRGMCGHSWASLIRTRRRRRSSEDKVGEGASAFRVGAWFGSEELSHAKLLEQTAV